MKIEYWNYSEINEDGTIGYPVRPEMGSLKTEGGMQTSGLHHAQTHYTKRDGLWLSVSSGRLPDGTMHGITIYFRDDEEMAYRWKS